MRRRKIRYWREDSFRTTNGSILKYDKLEHALLGFIGMLVSLFWAKASSPQEVLLFFVIWNIIGLLWELFQLLIQQLPIEIKDLAANNIGIVTAGILGYLIV